MASDGTIKIKTKLDNAEAEKAMSKFGKIAKTGCKGVAVAVGTVGTTLLATAALAVKTGIGFESSFAGVKKTVNASAEELSQMRQEIRDMSKEIPQSASSIAEVAEAAGQLGIENKNIISFSRVMSDLGVATNMSATEAATSLARLANITQMPQENFDRLGSTVVDLGNNLATTESEIVDIGLRLAGAGKQAGMSEAQILGLGAAISSVGIEAEAGGSAVSTVMAKMQLAVEGGGDSLEEFASVAGMSSQEFKAAFEEDAASAIVAFVSGLGTMDEQGQSAIKTLDDMGITEIRQRDALLRLSGAGDVLSKSLGIAKDAWGQNNALTNEAAQRYETLESKIQLFKNNISDFAITVYDDLRDPLANAVDTGIGGVSRLQDAFVSGGLKGTVEEAGKLFNEFADDVASSGNSAKKIVTPLKNIVNTGAKLAGDVLPVMAKGTKLVAENLGTLLPVATASVAAFKTMKIVESVSKWYKKASAASVAYTAAMATEGVVANASSTAHILLVSTMSASEKVIGVLTGRVELAAVAQATWNAVMNANPIGLVVTAAAALAAGLVVLSVVMGETSRKSYELSEKEKDVLKAANEATEALNGQREAREESVQAIDMEYDSYGALLSELKSITDENGRVKSGYEERAEVITGQLADALGTEIELTDGVIQNYHDTVAAIDEVITKKKAEALCSALQEDMADAYKKSKDAMLDYKEAASVLEDKQKDLNEAQEKYIKVSELYAGQTGPKELLIEKAEESLEKAQEAFDKASESVDGTRTALNELSTEVNNYDALVQAMAEGNTSAIESAMNSLLTGYQSYTAEMLASSQTAQDEMLSQAQEDINVLTLLLSEGGASYQAFGEDAAEAVANSVSNFNNLPGGIAAAIERIGPESAGAMLSALAQADLDGKLSEEGQKSVESLMSSFDGLDEGTREAFALAVFGALEGLEGFEDLADPAKEGADAFLESLRAALEVHSPSEAVRRIFSQVWPGAEAGLEEGVESLNEKGNSVIVSFLAYLGGTEIAETAKGIGSNIMRFFGIGVASQQENSRAAGKANADAANSGAGAVSPLSTGNRFGTLLGSGISAMAGLLFGRGKGLSDSAKSGTGSVDPTGQGVAFGQSYAGGISGQSRVSESAAAAIAQAANGLRGIASVSANRAGYNFGSGFAGGIRSAIGNAVSAAASLASNALSTIKSVLDIHSPSKKGRKLGRRLPQGVGLGIEDDTKLVEKASEKMSEAALGAIDADALSEQLKNIDVSGTMAKVYAAVEDKQRRVAENVVKNVIIKDRFDNLSANDRILSDSDMQKMGEIFAKRAAPLLVQALAESGLSMVMNGEKVGNLVSSTVDGNLSVASMKAGRYVK